MASLYEQLIAAKGAPRAAPAPNSTQMSLSPMNLRSAMRRYAVGGDVTQPVPTPMYRSPPEPQVTAADINSFVQANLNNPQAIAEAAQKYGVSADALANATGYSGQQINDYFGNAGLSPFTQSGVNATPANIGIASYGDTPEDFGYTQQYTPSLTPYGPKSIPPLTPYDPREDERRAREEDDRKRQREEESYYFKMLNERRAREEQAKKEARQPYSPISQIEQFKKLLEVLGRTSK